MPVNSRAPELLSPAGSAEGVSAAVQSGADAVYMSFAPEQDRRRCDLSEDEFGRAAQFARVRGVRIYAVLDDLPADEDLPACLDTARRALRMGADAIIANDLGLIWALRRAMPSMPIHAGPGLGVHNLDGVKLCAAMGVTRVALARELSRAQLAEIAKASPIELEVAVHGPMCAAFPGKCLYSRLRGEGSGPCPGLCLEGWSSGIKDRHPLAMRDNCLIGHLEELREMKIAALRIDGRERRPEYCAAVTGVYSRALGTLRQPSNEDMELLRGAFPAAGFTDGCFAGGDMADMLGLPGREPEDDTPYYAALRRNYLNREFQRVPVTFDADFNLEHPFRLTVRDDRGNEITGEGGLPELAFHQELTPAVLQTELYKTGGTPFRCAAVNARIQKGIFIDPREIAPVRDSLLAELLERRIPFEPLAESAVQSLPPAPPNKEPPVLTVFVLKCSQLSQRLFELAPPVIYLPLEEAVSGDRRLEPFLNAENISVCAVLPPVIYDTELGRLAELLLKARQCGINELAAGSIGHIIFARKLGFEVRGDLGLNVRNSNTLAVLLGLRLKSAALSMDLRAAQVRSVQKYLPAELVVYGRLPLMYTAGCLIRAQTGVCSCDSFTGLAESSGFTDPVTRGFGCRNTVWSANKLHLIKRAREYMSSGLWGVRLMFTTENAEEVVKVTERYLELGSYEPSSVTQANF